MNSTYRSWLEQQGYVAGTIQTQMRRAGRVEEHYGDLDEHYARDQLLASPPSPMLPRAWNGPRHRHPRRQQGQYISTPDGGRSDVP